MVYFYHTVHPHRLSQVSQKLTPNSGSTRGGAKRGDVLLESPFSWTIEGDLTPTAPFLCLAACGALSSLLYLTIIGKMK